jgi:hypothetical protein
MIIISTRPEFRENRRLKWSWGVKTPAEELESSSDSEADAEADTEADAEANAEANAVPKKRADYRASNSRDAYLEDEAQEELREPKLEVLGRGL